MSMATCLGCGCNDDNACQGEQGPCSWLRVDYEEGVGVCSECPDTAAAWDASEIYRPTHRDTVATTRRQLEYWIVEIWGDPMRAFRELNILSAIFEHDPVCGDLELLADLAFLKKYGRTQDEVDRAEGAPIRVRPYAHQVGQAGLGWLEGGASHG